MKANKYSNLKIAWFPDKLESFRTGKITAPIYVRLKPINRCNHDCFFCVYSESNRKDISKSEAALEHVVSGMHEQMDESDVMPTAKMLEALDDFKEMGVRAITFSGGGEPLMHKDMVLFMDRAFEYGIDYSIITNGQLLYGHRALALARAKWVRVSMDYTSAEEMAVSRRVDRRMFEGLLFNLRDFAAMGSSCELGVNFIIHRNNYHHLFMFAGILRGLGVQNVRFSPMWTPDFEKYHAPIKDEVLEQLSRIKTLEADGFTVNSSYDISASSHSPSRGYSRCFFMQMVPVIGADQKVYACHNKAYDDSGCIGSIKNQSFKDLWFSEDARKVFEGLNPMHTCQHQCANDSKNILIHELLAGYGDNFV